LRVTSCPDSYTPNQFGQKVDISLPRFSPLITAVPLLLCAHSVFGQQNPICVAPETTGLDDEPFLSQSEDIAPTTMTIEAGSVDLKVGPDPAAILTGGVLIRRDNRLAGADSAVYDPVTEALSLTGQVRYKDPTTSVTSDSAELSYSTGRIYFAGAEFQLGNGSSRGAADEIEISRNGTLSLTKVNYTTCPPGSNDWLIEAADINLDTRAGKGKAKNVTLRFQGIPILYAPRLTFPIGDARLTGFLAPEIGRAGRSGNEIRLPWYWNISENYDATITPRLLTDRGLMVGSEFRYLTKKNSGVAQFEYLANDSQFGGKRQFMSLEHRTLFDNGWRNTVDYRQISDDTYFEDLGGSLSTASITHLNRSAAFDYFGENWSFLGRVQEYQTIDEMIAPNNAPYRRLPQVRISAQWPTRPLGLRYDIDTELVYFDRDVGVTGWRLNAMPQVSWSLERPGWFVKPAVALQFTQYELENTEPGQRTSPSRTLPTSSLDIGMILERTLGSSNKLVQTIEPRLLYVHTPFREQSDLPVFDTIEPDLNLVQLFRKNRFLGVDRIADTDQLSIGITSRVFNASSGSEIVTATIGQTLYLSEQGVTFPGQPNVTNDSSDYIAELRFLIYKNFNFDIGHQWGSGANGTAKSEARLQYQPATNKVLNLAYRFRRQTLEQTDVSWSWPLSSKWNFVGRYNYSLRDNKSLEQFFGLEYESCCWGLRLVSRRYVSTRNGERNSLIGIQLVLKGMASVGTRADRILERGILGYSREFE